MGLVSLIADAISRPACFPGRRRTCLCLLGPWAAIPVSGRARSCGSSEALRDHWGSDGQNREWGKYRNLLLWLSPLPSPTPVVSRVLGL